MDDEDRDFITKLISRYMGNAGALSPEKHATQAVKELEAFFIIEPIRE